MRLRGADPWTLRIRAGVALAGRKFDLSAKTKPAIHIITLYAFDRIHQLVAAKSEKRPPLTPREREVLAWSAQGKSAWEIGEILSSSAKFGDRIERLVL